MGGIQDRLEKAKEWATHSGEILMDMQGDISGVRAKGDLDFVSDADMASQRVLLRGVSSLFPDDGFLFEEDKHSRKGTTGFTWVVDPLDGTTNYLHGHAHYAVSIGLLRHGVPVGGVVYAPKLSEMFYGAEGVGAFLNGERISVSHTDEIAQALLSTGFPYDRRERMDLLVTELSKAMMHARGVRRAGAAALDLAYIACGRYDGFWERGLSWWDVTAGVALIRQAGGEWGAVRMDMLTDDAPELLVATNGHLFSSLSATILDDTEIARYAV